MTWFNLIAFGVFVLLAGCSEVGDQDNFAMKPPIGIPVGATLSDQGFVNVRGAPAPPVVYSPFRLSRGATTRSQPLTAKELTGLFRKVPQHDYTGPHVQPLWSGEIWAEDGCIYISAGTGTHLLEIEPHHSVGIDPDGYLAILGSRDEMWARLGTSVTFSGGGNAQDSDVELQKACGHPTVMRAPELSNFKYERPKWGQR